MPRKLVGISQILNKQQPDHSVNLCGYRQPGAFRSEKSNGQSTLHFVVMHFRPHKITVERPGHGCLSQPAQRAFSQFRVQFSEVIRGY